jgi:glycolate oxidase FAD binding subunit
MVVTTAADVSFHKLQKRLAKADQWAALDGDPNRPVGWLMQHDSTGPLRLGYGGWRDVLTGVQFTEGQGDLVTAGGITVKNVAGYDLVKFMAGSHGCFGAPVTVTLRTYRRPEAAMAVTLSWNPEWPAKLLESEAPPQWMLWTGEGMRAGWLGRQREITLIRGEIATCTGAEPMERTLEEDAAERLGLLNVGTEWLRIHLPPNDLPAFVSQMRGQSLVADPVFGVVWMPVPETFSAVLAALERFGGHAIWLGRDGVRVFGVSAEVQALLLGLKRRLDPKGKLPPLPFAV